MGKPRMIILIRHAQSEGNKNRDIHQFIPDHRVKLTPDGTQQAEEAGRRLRSILRPDDTLQFYTSPYRRTRETTEGILKSLTSDDPKPSPFPRHKIKVYEEPRLREQDFGNFQPCSAEMERMWQERADYGHFFYRIPNGESAADAYDRISGFNESLWRQFGEEDFPSVCVLVTHGMMSRVFLMKWYHWSVEYFEDLRNVNHCEFVIMKQNQSNGKFILENEMRTWSDLKRRAAAGSSTTSPTKSQTLDSQNIPIRRWGGCVNGCNHGEMQWPRKNQPRRQNTADFIPTTVAPEKKPHSEKKHSLTGAGDGAFKTATKAPNKIPALAVQHETITEVSTDVDSPPYVASPNQTDVDADGETSEVEPSSPVHHKTQQSLTPGQRQVASNSHSNPSRDPGGSSPSEGFFSEDSDYFPKHSNTPHRSIASVFGSGKDQPRQRAGSRSSSTKRKGSVRDKKEKEKEKDKAKTEAGWAAESGMLLGARADALGDAEGEKTEVEGEIGAEADEPSEVVLEQEKMKDRKTFSEVY